MGAFDGEFPAAKDVLMTSVLDPTEAVLASYRKAFEIKADGEQRMQQ